MSHLPSDWESTDLKWNEVCPQSPIAKCFGWSFYEHPTLGDEHPLLAVTLDRIGDHGPIVYNTGDYDVPEYL